MGTASAIKVLNGTALIAVRLSREAKGTGEAKGTHFDSLHLTFDSAPRRCDPSSPVPHGYPAPRPLPNRSLAGVCVLCDKNAFKPLPAKALFHSTAADTNRWTAGSFGGPPAGVYAPIVITATAWPSAGATKTEKDVSAASASHVCTVDGPVASTACATIGSEKVVLTALSSHAWNRSYELVLPRSPLAAYPRASA
jgi:hypothetical protein